MFSIFREKDYKKATISSTEDDDEEEEGSVLATSAEANSTEAVDLPLNSTKLPPQLSENLRMFQSIHVLRSREEEELEEEGEEEEGAEAGEEK